MNHEVPYEFKYVSPAERHGIRYLLLWGENGEFVKLLDFPPRGMLKNKLAFPLMEHGPWLGAHRDATVGLVTFSGNYMLDSAEYNMGLEV